MDQRTNVSIAKDVDRAVAIIVKDDKALVMHRINRGKEYYTFIGGGIEEGESTEQAVVREVWEESSIVMKPERLVYKVEWANNGSVQYFYLCSYVSGEPILAEDSVEKELMRTNPEQHYEPIWLDVSRIPEVLLYPLEVADLFVEDVGGGFSGEAKTLNLDLKTCRQQR